MNAAKADFSGIYRQPDPRGYYGVLGSLDYIIPEVASPVLLQLVEQLIERKRRAITILDVGCSYGVLASVMRHGLTMDQLRERYASPAVRGLTAEGVAARDEHYFASWPRRPDLHVIGLDASKEAIGYAHRVGLLDEGLAVDLETSSLNDRARQVVAKADLIVSTGAVGYVTERTFSKLLSAFEPGREPWVACFVLRAFDFSTIAAALGEQRLATERFRSATFVQRRFRDAVEYESTLQLLRNAGVDPEGKEAEGLLHAEFFLSRPQADAGERSVDEMISLSSGGSRPRFRHRFQLASVSDEELAA